MKALKYLVVVCFALLSGSVLAIENKKFCVWDPVGKNGPVMAFYSDLIPKAQAWGLNIRFVPYTDEKVAANEFKAGNCDAVLLSAILSRQFVKFGGTMDAIGAITSQEGLERVLATMAMPKAGRLMISENGKYEVIATFPVGSMFAFVNDRAINHIDRFSGKKMSILNDDPQAMKFANLAGATPVGTTLTTFAAKFNNGSLDILFMPALAYNTFELYHGLGEKGGIIDYRLYYGMLQTIAKRNSFPEIYDPKSKQKVSFGHRMRTYMLTRLEAMKKMIKDAEDEIPSKYWIKTDLKTRDYIKQFSKNVRVALKDEEVNHPTALKLFWKVRCGLDPSRGECAHGQRRNNPEFSKPKKKKKTTKKRYY